MNAALIRALLDDDEPLPLPLMPEGFDRHYRVNEAGVRVVDVPLTCAAFSEPYFVPVSSARIGIEVIS